MNKAYSTFIVKEIDDDKRVIKGVASTVSPDRDKDILEPRGAKFKTPFPLLSQHEHHLPIGMVRSAKVSDDEITIEGEIAKGTDLEYIDTAWKQIKHGLVRGLSVGFRALEYAFKDDGGIHFKEWEIFELSAVTIPANMDCTITAIKNFTNDPSLRSLGVSAIGVHPRVAEALALQKRLQSFRVAGA